MNGRGRAALYFVTCRMSAVAVAEPAWPLSSVYVTVNTTCDAAAAVVSTDRLDSTVIVPFGGTRGTWTTPGPVKVPSAVSPFDRAKCVAVKVAPAFPPVSWG